ncbi:hypothetical protein QQ045_001699 [Rhodiola kirilowii]
MPDSLPDWVFDFVTNYGGYFVGNGSPARMNFRWKESTPKVKSAEICLV